MTAINHALTGAVIASVVPVPELALPAAFLSHYILDIVPHFGSADPLFIRSRRFKLMLLVDALLCSLLVGVIALVHPAHWGLLTTCAFLAAAPDFFWINKYLHEITGKARQWKPNVYSRFASRIQWFQKPIGGIVEAGWLIAALIVLTTSLVVGAR